jgi:hypothetical protein
MPTVLQAHSEQHQTTNANGSQWMTIAEGFRLCET